MRIAIVGTELRAVDVHGGGLEQVLRTWATSLAAHHDVVIVSHRRGGRPVLRDPDDGYDLVVVDRTSDLVSALRRLGADIVSLHNRPHWVDHVDARVSVGLTFHNYPTAWKWRGRRLPAARLSAVSAALAGAAAAHLDVASDAVTVVPPPIDAAYCRARPRRPHAVVLSPNRLMRKKGVAQLLDVASRSEFAGIRFEFADLLSPWLRPTREHRELRSAIGGVANASLFAPMADPDTLATRYTSAGVVVCAAQEPEGLGLVPLEAQATGTPVVTTDAGGLREATFAPNECVPVGDLDALADALMRALNGGSQSEAPRRAVIARHAPEVSAAAFGQWLTAAG